MKNVAASMNLITLCLFKKYREKKVQMKNKDGPFKYIVGTTASAFSRRWSSTYYWMNPRAIDGPFKFGVDCFSDQNFEDGSGEIDTVRTKVRFKLNFRNVKRSITPFLPLEETLL